MKKVFFVLMCVLFAKVASAQKDLLAFNEQNKYMYYQVVGQPGVITDTLNDRALYFLEKAYPKNTIKKGETSGNYTGTGKFLVVSGLTMAKHIEGEVNYTYYIECKDQKYRYWLTDFVFTPYKVDRYGNSVPQEGIDIPLESATTKLDKKQVDSYLDQIGTYGKAFGDKLKYYILKPAALPKETKKKVISTKDW
ncbi:DUF4468 domain-containing protein [Mucilaginibacter sp. X5P1]|uniref:DUF4468 domain-containing protein n=1 Tax=Mucilaginibacter sp. X5P1 TaxID=2723088 RepID=UPI00160ADDCB|nr:DUF4468 domain-containing protein [Mucilaginibacter sp. X5P1]MBB6137718.1 hypothetical protein [Mucilaginibacter sp. X5P1]